MVNNRLSIMGVTCMNIELDDEYVDKIVSQCLLETWSYICAEIQRLDMLSDEKELTSAQQSDLEDFIDIKPSFEKVLSWYIPYSKYKELGIE